MIVAMRVQDAELSVEEFVVDGLHPIYRNALN